MDRSKCGEMIAIGVPAVMESLVAVVIATIDTKMISVLGEDPIAAISFTTQPKLIVYSVFFALGTAMSIFIAQAFGKKDREEARKYLKVIIRIALILGIILGALFAIFAHPVMSVCSRQTETLGMSVVFFRIIMAGLVLQGLVTVLNGALRGIGKTKLTFISSLVMGVTDVVFNYFLIEGHMGFPRLEVAGDALATVISIGAACIVSGVAMARGTDFLSLKGALGRETELRSVRKDITAKAGNIVQENILLRIGFLISSIIVSCLSPGDTAVYAVAMILLTYSFAFGDGIQNAVIALVGKSVGAGNIKDIRKYLGTGIMLACISAVALGIIYVIISRWFLGLYFGNEEFIAMGIKMIWIVAGISLFQILRIVFIASMRGVGETRIPKWIALVCVLIISPGTSALFVFVFNMGIWGIWLSAVITQVAWSVAGMVTCRKCIAKIEEEACL